MSDPSFQQYLPTEWLMTTVRQIKNQTIVQNMAAWKHFYKQVTEWLKRL